MRIITLATALLIAGAISAQTDTTFKPSGKVYGYTFGDLYYKVHADSLNRSGDQYSGQKAGANAFSIRRIYLGYTYKISPKFTSDVLLSYEGNTLSDGSRTMFIKSANLRWKDIWKNTDLIIGQQATPAFPMMAEPLWGYRSIEKTIGDMRHMASSNDLGIGIQGKLNDKGDYGYDLLIANGTSQKDENDVFKKMYGDVYAKFFDQKLIIDAYGDFTRTLLLPGFHQYQSSMKFDVIWNSPAITVGTEMFMKTDHNYVVSFASDATAAAADTADQSEMGISIFMHGAIIKDQLNFFARYDIYNPDTKFDANRVYLAGSDANTQSFITAGIDYTPTKNVHLMPNIYYNDFSNRTKNATGVTKSDFDLVPRLTFYYIYK